MSACRSISAGSRSSFKNLRSSVTGLIQLALLRLGDARIRKHHPIGHEIPLEKSLRKPQRLGPCKKQFLSLLNLFLSLRVEFIHSIEKRATSLAVRARVLNHRPLVELPIASLRPVRL